MKNLVTILVLAFSVSAFANHHETPCKNIEKACEAAGYTKGNHKNGKGLHVDCLQKIKKGETVEGVTVAPEELAACTAKVEAHKAKHNK